MRISFKLTFLTVFLSGGSFLLSGADQGRGEAATGIKVVEAAGSYQWGNVVVGGGGWMVSLEVHPTIPDLLWLGSDVSGPWKRAPGQESWQPQAWNEWSPRSYGGVLSLAVDPRNADTVYVERGYSGDKADGKKGVYVTRDGGKSWSLALSKFASSNDGEARKWGPSIAVDPNNPDVVYYGTWREGIWRSTDTGKTWSQVMAPPELRLGQTPDVLDPGVRCLAIDPTAKIKGRSAVVYAGLNIRLPGANKAGENLLDSSVEGLYRSTDGGDTFAQVPEFKTMVGASKEIRHMYCGTNGTLFINHDAGLARLDKSGFKDITPAEAVHFVEGGLAVNPSNPKEVLLIGIPKRQSQDPAFLQAIFRSRDGGDTWTSVTNNDAQMSAENLPQWLTHFNDGMRIPASGSFLAFDPFHAKRAYVLDAFGVYQTEDIWADKVTWHSLYEGVENAVALTLCAPPPSTDGNAPMLLSGFADIRGFRHADIHQPPLRIVEPTVSTSYDWTTHVTDYDYCEGNPAVVMCAKSYGANSQPGKILLSEDGGQTWKMTSYPLGHANCGGGKIAVSAKWNGSTETLKAVFVPGANQKPFYTADGGKTWQTCKNVDGSDLKSFSGLVHAYNFSQRVAADRVDGETFYIYDAEAGSFWVSRDGGATWKEKPFSQQKAPEYDSFSPPSIQAAPGRGGEVWAAMAGFGIKRTRDFGDTWETLPGTVSIGNNQGHDPKNGRPTLVTFGAPAPGRPANEPTVYVFVRLSGDETSSLLRSSDVAQKNLSDMAWKRVQKWDFGAILPNIMQGSRQKFGQVFMGASNYGVTYGEPAK